MIHKLDGHDATFNDTRCGAGFPEPGSVAVVILRERAFRLEPQNGIVAIDGERVACEPTQGEVHQGLLSVMA